MRRPFPELAILAVLVVWNIGANVVTPEPLAIPVNLLAAGLLVLVARRGAAASWQDLGLDTANLGRSLRLGALVVAGIAGIVVAAALLPPVRSVLADGRFAEIGAGEAAYETLARIPLATALAEEVAFRAVLLGVLLSWMAPLRALLVSSALFGLWHVLPGIAALDTTSAIDAGESTAAMVGAVAGQVIVTAIAGAGFSWLRFRSGHIAAAVVAHWGLNAVAFFVGWQIVRNGWA